MKIFLLAISLTLAGCASHLERVQKEEGKFFASIQITQTAFFGPVKKPSGYYFFFGKPPLGSALMGYELINGKVTDFAGADNDIAKEIDKIGFEPFDFKKEAGEVEKRTGISSLVFDGAEYEITIVTPQGIFKMRDWNPKAKIEAYAPYSEKIAKLQALLRLLELHYGRAKIGF